MSRIILYNTSLITFPTSFSIKTLNTIVHLEKVDIKEHEKVTVILHYPNENQTKECNLYGIIDIAKDCSDTGLSIHHDKYLYGEDTD